MSRSESRAEREIAATDAVAAIYDRRISIVEHSSTLQPSAELEHTEREIAATDREIDDLFYDQYGITDEERKIIEGSL